MDSNRTNWNSCTFLNPPRSAGLASAMPERLFICDSAGRMSLECHFIWNAEHSGRELANLVEVAMLWRNTSYRWINQFGGITTLKLTVWLHLECKGVSTTNSCSTDSKTRDRISFQFEFRVNKVNKTATTDETRATECIPRNGIMVRHKTANQLKI